MLESIAAALGWLFGGDLPHPPLLLHQVCARAIVVYLGGIAIVRLGKSRLIARTTALDVLLGFVLGSLLSRGITGSASLSATLASSAVMVACHWGVTWMATRSDRFEGLLKGRPALVIEDGALDREAMADSHLSEQDVREALRLRGVEGTEGVRRAWKEPNGEISVIEA